MNPQLIPATYPFAQFVNGTIAIARRMPLGALVRQAQLAYPGDPLVGTLIAGTTIKWEAATQVQQLIAQWFEEGGQLPDANMQQLLDTYRGPFLPWNYSYNQFGLNPTDNPMPKLDSNFNPIPPQAS
jgi:hypothetical protein